MLKVISPSGWSFNEPVATPIKLSSRGLIGADRDSFVKRAGDAAAIFLPYLDQIKIADDEEPVHSLAVGAFEAWGNNRNGDAFDEKTAEEQHPTFVKFARCYRNHKNTDPSKSYGIIKASAYNPTMRRIELICAYNKTKSAADRNGGLVADLELQKLASGADLPGSMACKVAFDVCQACGNKARTREEYCTGSMCKAGGCKDNLAKVVKIGNDTFHCGVFNPNALYFDWSSVFRPADRTAYGGRADWLTKAAAANGFCDIGGAKAAEDLGLILPFHVAAQLGATDKTSLFVKLARSLNALERMPRFELPDVLKRAFAPEVRIAAKDKLASADTGENWPDRRAAFLGALADREIILPLRDFAAVFTKRAALADAAAQHLLGVIGRMEADGTLEPTLARNPYAVSSDPIPERLKEAADNLVQDFSLIADAVERRAKVAALRGVPVPGFKTSFENVKTAADNSAAEELARDYTLYKIAALQRISEFNSQFLLTARLSSCQDRIC